MVQSASSKDRVKLNEDTLAELEELRTKLNSALVASGPEWEGVVDRILSFGPRHTGPNILVNAVQNYHRPSLWDPLRAHNSTRQPLREYDNSIVSGFQLATLSGPLCEEPMHGVCFLLKEWSHSNAGSPEQPPQGPGGRGSDEGEVEGGGKTAAAATPDTYGPFSGQLISAMKEGCRRSFLARRPTARLMAAMFSSSILATADVLGKVYGVLGRRNGRVLADEMKEGSVIFAIQALVPVAESFGFAEEIRKRTSGLANPQLFFSHWEVSACLRFESYALYFLPILSPLKGARNSFLEEPMGVNQSIDVIQLPK